jgi:hypothetical protein
MPKSKSDNLTAQQQASEATIEKILVRGHVDLHSGCDRDNASRRTAGV